MRICRVVSNFSNIDATKGDLVPLFYNQIKQLVDAGYDMHVVCGKTKDQTTYENIDGIKVHRVSPIDNRRSYLFGDFAKRSFSKIKEINPDLIHGDTSIHFGCLWNKRKINAPLITHFHVIFDSYKYIDYLPISYDLHEALNYRLMIRSYFYENKYVFNKSDYIIGVSNAVKESILKYLPEKNIRVVYNGFDPVHFRRTESDIKDCLNADHLVLYAGRPIPWKGVQYLIAATEILNEQFGNLKVLLLNVVRSDMKIYYEWLMSIAKKSKVNNIIFSGGVSYSDLPRYYSSADCFALPSFPEGFGLVNLEAQGCSCPVVAANGGGTPEIMSEESGLLCNPKDTGDLAKKISIVLDNPRKFDGRKFAENFTWKKSAQELSKYYTEINNKSIE
jgi:glycosyltransferase involved in cell wall biosynthesis